MRRQKLARVVLDSMVQFVGLLDTTGAVLEINKHALDTAGVTLAEVEGRPLWTTIWWQVSDKVSQTLRAAIERAAQGEPVRWDTEIYGRAGDQILAIEASLCPVRDDTGSVALLCAEARDISIARALQRQLAAKDGELSAVLAQLHELDISRTRLVSDMRHDLRATLSLILGTAQRLVDDDGRLDLAARRDAGRLIARNAQVALARVNNLLDGSRRNGHARSEPLATEQQPAVTPGPLARGSMPVVVVPAGEHRLRVLVVEPDPDLNRFIGQCLDRDYEVVIAQDGRAGLELAVRHQPIAIIAGVALPGMPGAELVAELRKRPELATTPILIVSATADEDLAVELLDGGAQDFVLTPCSERELVVRVRNLVAGHLARVQVHALHVAADNASRAKDEFLAMLGHELRNPLSPILSALQLMALRNDAGSQRERAIIERQVGHLTRLVDDLLDVARIARGKLELKTEIIEIAEAVGKAIEMVGPLVEQRRHALAVSVARRGLRVEGDVTRLSQVVSNLLTNAAKYTPPGGRIAITARREAGQIVLAVRDTGIGIADDVLPDVFDLFVQGRQASGRAQGGLGVGLTIVRSLVEHHGGTVTAHSDGPGTGSEFVVRLPAADRDSASTERPAAPATIPAPAPAPPGALRILIVDDNRDAAEMMSIALERRGYDIRVAYDGETALQAAAEFSPDIAVLDIGLPGRDGYQVGSQLRALPGLASVKLVAVTGYGQESDRQRTRDAGFDDHLVKPVHLDAIEATLKRACGRS